jgi:hypothetical protein
MAVRTMGRRQLPLGITIAVVSALVAYGAGYLASTVHNVAAKSLLVVTAGIAITVAWVVSWMVIESTTLDWRQSARQAFAYDLVARETLQVVTGEQRTEGSSTDKGSVAADWRAIHLRVASRGRRPYRSNRRHAPCPMPL